MLAIGLMLNPPEIVYVSQNRNELQLGQQQFYIDTGNSGAMAKGYHYVYLECPKPLGRYQLQFLGRIDWMLRPQFQLQGDEMVITGKRYSHEFAEERLPLAGHQCS
ncbi:hypothetical protein [Shewanella sp.]|uniref:hypothetical protein n=1 Tax=Shewanella sp. TaxID=50422 RepID=UPI003A982F4D